MRNPARRKVGAVAFEACRGDRRAVALTIPTGAQAAAVACGGGVSTGRVAVNGFISARPGPVDEFPTREITVYIKARRHGNNAVIVSYESFFRVVQGGHWEKVGSGRTHIRAGEAVGPLEVGSTTRACGPVKVEIRAHSRADGGA